MRRHRPAAWRSSDRTVPDRRSPHRSWGIASRAEHRSQPGGGCAQRMFARAPATFALQTPSGHPERLHLGSEGWQRPSERRQGSGVRGGGPPVLPNQVRSQGQTAQRDDDGRPGRPCRSPGTDGERVGRVIRSKERRPALVARRSAALGSTGRRAPPNLPPGCSVSRGGSSPLPCRASP